MAGGDSFRHFRSCGPAVTYLRRHALLTRIVRANVVSDASYRNQKNQMLSSIQTGDAVSAPEFRWRAFRALVVAIACSGLAACGGTSFRPESMQSVDFQSRAQTQDDGDLTVRAAVPGPDETRRLFGVPLYDRSIQPVWLEVENRGPVPVRFAPTGIDDDYFSPVEVAYIHRGGFSKRARAAMERYYHDAAMDRFVEPGERESGFVFTNARPGTKAFNVDLFGPKRNDYSFTFFIDVPGFIPDHAEVNFAGLYTEDQVTELDEAGLRGGLDVLPRYTTDAAGTAPGEPVNVVFIGHGPDLRAALLRSDWQETAASSKSGGSPASQSRHLFGRRADAVLRKARGKNDRNELRIWLAPMRVNGHPVWLAQVTHQLPGLFGIVSQDPDIDDARYYLLQSFWYGQSLAQLARRASIEPVPVSESVFGFKRRDYFTDGYQLVLWPSADPVSLLEVVRLQWDPVIKR
jgi:hypothetical protein